MIAFQVKGMSCNHCVAAVTRAVRSVHEAAEVKVDLAAGRVEIDAGTADAAALRAAIEDAGYEVLPA